MTYALFYAGMAGDLSHEQIGLALSEDGLDFHRHPEREGLILTSDPTLAWKSRNVCNPFVFREGDCYTMLYQGVNDDADKASIGRAVSKDGLTWVADPEPCLPWQAGESIDPAFSNRRKVYAIEPCLRQTERGYELWFVYCGPGYPGNAIFRAESSTLFDWRIDPKPVFTGQSFGGSIWYPQLVEGRDGITLYFTVRGWSHGVYKANSSSGKTFGPPQYVAGEHFDFYPLGRRLTSIGLSSRFARKATLLAESGLLQGRKWLGLNKGAYGIAHSHHMKICGQDVIYVHCYNRDPFDGRRYMEIGRFDLSPKPASYRTVLERSASDNWDGFFVADPFVMELY